MKLVDEYTMRKCCIRDEDDNERYSPGCNGCCQDRTGLKKLCNDSIEAKYSKEFTGAEESNEPHGPHDDVLHLQREKQSNP